MTKCPHYVANLVLRNLPVAPAQARIAALGLAMKDYSNDDRMSPALAVIAALEEAGCRVRAYDPAVPNHYPFKVDSLEEAVTGAHGIVILARQHGLDAVNFDLFKRLMAPEGQPFIVDTKNLYDPELVWQNGFKLERL